MLTMGFLMYTANVSAKWLVISLVVNPSTFIFPNTGKLISPSEFTK